MKRLREWVLRFGGLFNKRRKDRDLDEELPRAVANMRNVQRRIFLIVPATAISTVLIAAFFGWAIGRRILELRLEERVSERTRIARELHDTLLQSFHGLMLRLEVVNELLPQGKAKGELEQTLERADQAIAEGREAVYDLRSSAMITNDLAQAVKKQNVPFTVAYTYTGFPMVMLAREFVRNGDVGEVRKVEAWYPQGWLATKLEAEGQKQASWRVDPGKAGASGCGIAGAPMAGRPGISPLGMISPL